MCDNSGVIYAGDDDRMIMIDLDGVDLDMGLDGIIDRISLSPDDLSEPDPKCRWCKGTGKVKLLVSESDCDCVTKPPNHGGAVPLSA